MQCWLGTHKPNLYSPLLKYLRDIFRKFLGPMRMNQRTSLGGKRSYLPERSLCSLALAEVLDRCLRCCIRRSFVSKVLRQKYSNCSVNYLQALSFSLCVQMETFLGVVFCFFFFKNEKKSGHFFYTPVICHKPQKQKFRRA